MKEAPLFTQAYTLFNWLLQQMEKGRDHAFLRGVVLDTGRGLIESLTLGLQGFDTLERAYRADEALALLRLHLRLSEDNGLLDERQYRYAVGEMDEMGRQIGGWLKSMKAL